MMNNPLNQAHHHARKAEQLTTSGKYSEAISCHEKAVEYLDQALSTNLPACSVESLTLQRDNHIKQQGILRLKRYQHLSRKQHAQKIAQAKFPEIEIRQDDKELHCRPVKQSRDQLALRHCFQETDTLLNFLENRRAGSLMTISEFQDQPQDSTYKKLPKDEKTIIEELRHQNALLRDHVVELLRENDTLKNEADSSDLLQANNSLKGQVDSSQIVDDLVEKVIENSIMYDSTEPEAFCDLPPGGVDLRSDMELPPLEEPQFEFKIET